MGSEQWKEMIDELKKNIEKFRLNNRVNRGF